MSYPPEPRTIRLVFQRSASIEGGTISFFTWSWPSHVDLMFEDGTIIGSLPGKGVTVQSPGVFSFTLSHSTRHEMYSVTVDNDTYGRIKKFVMAQKGKPYDWGGILGFLARTDRWQAESRWFCSELVAAAFEYAGLPLIKARSNRVTPGMVLMSPYLKQV